MTQSQQFLEDFEQKMSRLAGIRRDLQASIQFKTQFTNDLKTNLGEINDKIRQLAGLINELKTKANDLERQVGEHTTSISDKERQIREINSVINDTSAEKDRVTQEFNEHRDRTQADINDKQNRIEQMEEQLRQLTEQLRVVTNQKENAENSLRALQAETQASGNQKDIEHAEAIRQLSEANERQLQEQRQQLTQRIEEADSVTNRLEQQLRQKIDEYQQTQQQLNDHQTQAQGQVAELQRQIDVLTQENQQLIQRLMAATQAINEANDELETIVNSVPNAQTKQEVDALLNEITQQLEQSIQNISRAAQGQQLQEQVLPPPPLVASQPGRIAPNTPVQINGYNMTYGQIISQLDTKARQEARNTGNKDNKYKRAADQLRVLNDPAQIPAILGTNGVNIKAGRDGNGVISGGRKTKKNRKQKGGFTYKIASKRKDITSKSSRRSSRNSSRRSSRNSSRRSSR
jgi:chromosome segregation ATPase